MRKYYAAKKLASAKDPNRICFELTHCSLILKRCKDENGKLKICELISSNSWTVPKADTGKALLKERF